METPFDLTFIGHSTVLLEMEGVRLLTDPVLRNRVGFLRRYANGLDIGRHWHVDAVLLSHVHIDHLDYRSLRLLARGTLTIVPRGAASLVRRAGLNNVVEMVAGEEVRVGPLTVRATPAVHSRRRYPFGPEADTLGYVIGGASKVYFAGDTGSFPEMKGIATELDIAMLPVWGWGFHLGKHHLDPERAAEALLELRPRMAIPIHWGTLCPAGVGWLNPGYLREPPCDFVRHAARIAPGVEVRVLAPGGMLRYDAGGRNGAGPG
jgi:L-ascorbate metabolism protein UlaG (beta-lactamase superfamily)